MSELYARLGLSKGASSDEIKKTYRKLALQKHPDRGGNKEEFQMLNEAYEILMDPARRAEYDATGVIPAGGASVGAASGMGGGGMPDLSGIFGNMFGGGGPGGGGGFGFGIPFPFFGGGGPGGGGGPSVKQARGPNKIQDIGISIADLYYGKTFTLNVKRDVICSTCEGSGGTKHESCASCSGRGVRMRAQQMGPVMAMSQEACDACQQTGRRILEKCGECVGRRVVETNSTLNVNIEPGMAEGDRIVFAGQCSESPQFEAPGDIILVIRTATTDPAEWTRNGADLAIEVRMSLAEAMLGWERRFDTHPSGHPLHLVWNGGPIRYGEVLRVPGWGMPVRGSTSGEKGSLRLMCVIDDDKRELTEEQMRVLRQVWPEWQEPSVTDSTVRPIRLGHP